MATGAPSRSNAGDNKRRPNSLRSNISGTKVNSTLKLTGVQRVFDLFLGGCMLDTTTNDIIDYCKFSDIILKKCVQLNSKSEWYTSFKLSVVYDDREKLLVPEFWPQGSFVRRYFKPRQSRD